MNCRLIEDGAPVRVIDEICHILRDRQQAEIIFARAPGEAR
jgi:hypothetical protein